MINGCVKGQDDCGCDCHRIPGVVHIRPCCDKPPARRWRDHSSIVLEIEELLKKQRYDTNKDPGDESENQ